MKQFNRFFPSREYFATRLPIRDTSERISCFLIGVHLRILRDPRATKGPQTTQITRISASSAVPFGCGSGRAGVLTSDHMPYVAFSLFLRRRHGSNTP
jgi:hypothetical protein